MSLKGSWRRGVPTSELMKIRGSNLIVPGLGSPVPQQRAPHLSSSFMSFSTILSSHFQPCRRVSPEILPYHQASGVAKWQIPFRQCLEKEIRAFRDRSRFQEMTAELHSREAQSAQPIYRREGDALRGFEGARGHGNNVAQVEALSPQARSRAAKCTGAAKVIGQNRKPSFKVVDGTESRQQISGSLELELERVGGLKVNITRYPSSNLVLELRVRKSGVGEEEGQASFVFKIGVIESSVRFDLRTEDLLRNGLWMDDRLTPAWMEARLNCTAPARLQSRTSCASRVWLRETQQNGRTHAARFGTTSEALATLKNRLQRGTIVESYVYVDVLKRCSKQKDLLTASQVHDCIIQSGLEKNIYVANSLVNVYSQCGKLLDARRVFDQLEKKSVVTWTTMIAGYAKYDHTESAFEIFYQMRREGWQPDEITYLSILKACTSPKALKWGKEVHVCIRRAGFESDVRVTTALLQMYAKCGCITAARQVFNRMERRNLITWNTMISALAQDGRGREAHQLFLQMRQEGFQPDVVSWNIVIGGLARHGCGHEAYQLFLQMPHEGSEPDAYTYASIFNASDSAGTLEWVKEVHRQARIAGLESHSRVASSLVHIYAKSGSIDDARIVFDKMEKPDVVTWNVMIGGLAQHGCGHEALELFRIMNVNGVKPNSSSFVAVLSACSHVGLLDEGRRLFSTMMEDFGIEPNVMHYTCMVDILGRAGHLEEAKLLISEMPLEPDAVIWTALLGACRTYGNVELGELAAKEIFKLEPNNAAGYVALSNIYAAAGKWEKVSSVRTRMQEIGARKERGRSWIEVDGNVHEFVVGDACHPEADAIYTYLKTLTQILKTEGYIPDTRLVLHNINKEDKELALCSHSEKLAIAYGLMHIPSGKPILVYKNLRVCPDCHLATKLISKVTGREIVARDASRFHHFKNGICSCGDYW